MTQNHLTARVDNRWLATLTGARNADALRDAMCGQYPGVDFGRLDAIAIVGATNEGQRLARICRAEKISIEAIVDDDARKTGAVVSGCMVEPTHALTRLPKSRPVVIASHRVHGASQKLRDLGFKTVMAFATLQVPAPGVFAPHMFYDELLDELWAHRAEYGALNDRLADERSRAVLDVVPGFRQTLDPAVLRPVVSEDDLYASEGLFDFSDDEVSR
jgi:hypothetical protein